MGKEISSLNVLVGTSVAGFVKGMDKAIDATKKKGRQWEGAMTQAMRWVGGALLGIGVASVKMAADFETSLTKMRTLVGLGAEDVEKFKSQIIALSKTTGRSAVELAEGMYFITSSGLQGAEAMKALESSAKAASIGMGETQVIADALTSVINAYGKEAYTASEATNLLLKTVRLGKAEADQLAGSIGEVIPNAALMGVSFEEVGAAISVTTLSGKSAGEAITGLNQILFAFLDPSDQAKNILDGIRKSAADVRKEIRENGLQKTLITLGDALGWNEEKLAQLLGRKEAVTTFWSVLGENSGVYVNILKEMKIQQDLVNESMDIWATTKGAKYDKAMTRLGDAAINAGDQMSGLIDFFAEAVDPDSPLNDWNNLWKQMSGRFDEVWQQTETGKRQFKELREEAAKAWVVVLNPTQQPTGMSLLSYGQTPRITKKDTEVKETKQEYKSLSDQISELEKKMQMQIETGQDVTETMELWKQKTKELEEAQKKLNQAYVESSRIFGSGFNYQKLSAMSVESPDMADIDETTEQVKDLTHELDNAATAAGYLSNMLGVLSEIHLRNLEEESDRTKDAYKAQYDALESNYAARRNTARMSNEYQTQLDAEYASQSIALNSKMESEQRQSARRRAKAQKNAAIMQINLDTAQAIMRIWASSGNWKENLAWTIAVAAIGAAQLGAAEAQQIPQFASGGLSGGGYSLVGERGPEIVNLPAGSQVYSNAHSRAMGGMQKIMLTRNELIVWVMEGIKQQNTRRGI